MAITPLTRPAEMGEFIPQQPRLPVDDIASATQNIYKQERQQESRLNEITNQLAKRQASEFDRKALRSLEDRYNRKIENLASDENLLFDDREKISQMAREFTGQARLLEQNKKNVQKQLEQIDNLENLSEPEKQARKNAYLQDAGLETTEEGLIDPDSVFSPTSVGEEPESLQKKARELAKDLPERFLGEGISRDPATGKIKVSESSGVSGQRIMNMLLGKQVGKDEEGLRNLVGEDGQYEGALYNDPQVQNWMKQKRESLVANRGYSPEQARSSVNNQLKNAAASVIDNFSYQDINSSRYSRPDSGDSGMGEDEFPAIATPAPMRGVEDAQNKTEEKELKSQRRYVKQKALEDMFSDQLSSEDSGLSEKDIRDIQNTLENPPESSREWMRGAQGNLAKAPIESGREAALRKIENKYGSDIADRVRNEFEQTYDRISGSASYARRSYVTPAQDTRLAEVERALDGVSPSFIKSSKIDKVYNDWWTGNKSSLKKEVLQYGRVAAMDNEQGNFRIKMPLDNKNVSEGIQGESFEIRVTDNGLKNSLQQSFANVIEKSGDKWTADAIRENLRYQDVAVETATDDWSEIGGEGFARYNPQRGGFEVATDTNDKITFGDVSTTEGRIDAKTIAGFVPKAKKLEDFPAIDSRRQMVKALKAHKTGNYETGAQERQIKKFLNTAVPFEHKGMALNYLNKFPSSE